MIKKVQKSSQKICCDVDTCVFQDRQCKCCTLDEITVQCDCECAKETKDTVCGNYEKEDK